MAKHLSLGELFFGFLKIGMIGFGGVAPVTRHVMVVEREWLSETEFAALRGYGTVLPGPNVTNMAVMLGYQNQGWLGAVAAAVGIMFVPLLFMLGLALIYDNFRETPPIAHAVNAMAAASGGLVAGTGVKMAWKLGFKGRALIAFLAVIGAVAVANVSLPIVLLVMLPLGIAVEFAIMFKAGR